MKSLQLNTGVQTIELGNLLQYQYEQLQDVAENKNQKLMCFRIIEPERIIPIMGMDMIEVQT